MESSLPSQAIEPAGIHTIGTDNIVNFNGKLCLQRKVGDMKKISGSMIQVLHRTNKLARSNRKYEGIDKIIETHVEIINMTGEIVFAEKFSCGGDCGSYLLKINKQLVPGIYVVRMKTNGVTSVKRLLVK